MADQLNVTLINEEAIIKAEYLHSLDSKEEELYHAVENQEYVHDFENKYVGERHYY